MEVNHVGLEKNDKVLIKKSIVEFHSSTDVLSLGAEGHHISHVLTFFSYMAYNVGKGRGVRQRLLGRTIHHLKSLQEFIGNSGLDALVKSIIASIQIQYGGLSEDSEQPSETTRLWLINNQENILKLAECYGKRAVFDGLLPLQNLVRSGKVQGTAIQGARDSHLLMDEYRLSTLFQGYLNNKMTLLFFHIQARRFGQNPDLAMSSSRFLEDVYRHMLSPGPQRKHRWLFRWLQLFLKKLPHVSEEQRQKAKEFAVCVYDALGLHFKPNNV